MKEPIRKPQRVCDSENATVPTAQNSLAEFFESGAACKVVAKTMDTPIANERLLKLILYNARLYLADDAHEHDPPTFGNSCAHCGGQVQQMDYSELRT
jgi:hypothetical protein